MVSAKGENLIDVNCVCHFFAIVTSACRWQKITKVSLSACSSGLLCRGRVDVGGFQVLKPYGSLIQHHKGVDLGKFWPKLALKPVSRNGLYTVVCL